jgi:hypothetical protein
VTVIVATEPRNAASPVAFNVSVTLIVDAPVALSELLLHVAETPVGSPETARATVPA